MPRASTPFSSLRRRSSVPSPQPTSRTRLLRRDHVGDEQKIDARRRPWAAAPAHGAVAGHGQPCRFGRREPAGAGGGIEKAAGRRDELGNVEQKGVMAAIGLDIDEGDRGAAGIERMHDRA